MKFTTSVLSGLALCVVNVAAQNFGGLPTCAVRPWFSFAKCIRKQESTNTVGTSSKAALQTLSLLPVV